MQPALFPCWHTAYDAGPTFGQRCCIRPTINDRCTSQQTRAVDPMLFYYRADVKDYGPTFKQLCIIVGHVSYTVLAGRYAVLARQVKVLRVKVYCLGHVTRDVT